MKKYYLTLGCAVVLLLSACATKTGLEKYEGQSAQQIFVGAEKSLQKGDYKDASDRYEALEALYPYGDYAQQTELNIIYSYYKDRDYDSAIAAADRYTHLYPQGPATDYAYYMKGLAEFSRNEGFFERYLPLNISARDNASIQQAFNDFNDFLTRYPTSVYAPDARQRMVFLRNLLAEQQLQIGQYYYSRKAYVGAAERGRVVVTQYPHSDSVEAALVLMYQSYQQLQLTSDAVQVRAVLQANYPEALKGLK